MPHQFRGISEFIEAAAIARGFNPAKACPRTLLVSAAKANRLMTQVGDSLGQASTAQPENKAEITGRAIDILWQIGVMKEAVEAALLDVYAIHELPTEQLMKVIDNGSGHSDSNVDRRVGDDVGATENRRPAGRPR